MHGSAMMHIGTLLVIFLHYDLMCSLKDDVKRITAKEGNTVTLQPEVHALEIDAQILWSFNQNSKDPKIVNSQVFKGEINTEYSGRLKDRLLLDRNTGSLTIRNITTRESGIYRLHIISERISYWHFNCTVYAPVSAPNISRGHSHSNTKTAKSRTWSGAETQSSSNTSCQVLCSAKNDRQVSLSWFRANQLISQTSSPDVNTTLSLRLDIDEKDNTVYSCVSANPVSNDTTYLNITVMCMNQKDPSMSKRQYPIFLLPLGLSATIAIVAVGMCVKKKREYNISRSTGGHPSD
ncbi:CD48 antigen-like isoform X1 [Clupea harengus]|uniref:CD48 antigen-like isoform X1 n=1 Tax=Clupea harengus TaxID=7950 RepID=A0A8M1KAH8_CLUHA|nr:CD48 antigen-like isoform X1 [Clupea harengus]